VRLAGSRFSRRLRGQDEGPLPLYSGPVSNGEFVPAFASHRDRDTNRLVHEKIYEAASRSGVSRRRFLQSAGAVAAALSVFDATSCTASSHRKASKGGHYQVPPPTEAEACHAALVDKAEFIFDVHTHHVIPNGTWVQNSPETVGLVTGMLPEGCTDDPRLDCVDRASYLHDLFISSDTTMAMLSDVPNSGPQNAPVPLPEAIQTKQVLSQLTSPGESRLLVQNIIAPNVGPVEGWLEEMTAAKETNDVVAFKVYTAWSPTAQGFSLEDPTVGLPILQHAHDLGVKVFVAHKGLPLVNFDPAFNHPDDVVAVSRQFPDMNFVVYHAAWDPSHVEGPYDPTTTIGVDSLLRALDTHDVPPNDNVWVDLASLWRQLLTQPDQAAHALGKLLSRVGEKRVMWGTDAIWYGSPQPQIMAMRAFQISSEFQEKYGYPPLTQDTKAAIFGLNAASLFGIDTTALRCGLENDPLTAIGAEAQQLQAEGAIPSPWHERGPTARRDVLRWLGAMKAPWQPT
jgi:predicted TIM-barrel fold metal-dependent hydrolase